MAHSYTPGLRVAELTSVRKERRLPLKGKVSVTKGQAVKAQDVIAATHLPGNVHPVNCAGQLGLLPADVEDALMVKVGSNVEKNQQIAMAKSFFGMFKSYCTSPITGVLESASPITGQLILREPPIPVEISAYIDGEVVEIFADEGVAIETMGSFIQGIFGIGGERMGSIRMICSSSEEQIDISKIPSDCKGQILVGGSLITLDAYKKASEIGAAAIIVGGIINHDLKQLLGYEIGVAITGHEALPTTLVLTEGFGKISMAHRTFDLLSKHNGERASCSGATQIRAGVIRPEVIIPAKRVASATEKQVESGSLNIGRTVRVIRHPNFGKLGQVTALPPELQVLETGAKVRVLELEFKDKSRFVLPRANVELIEN